MHKTLLALLKCKSIGSDVINSGRPSGHLFSLALSVKIFHTLELKEYIKQHCNMEDIYITYYYKVKQRNVFFVGFFVLGSFSLKRLL